jgi:hypothetical protein
MPRHKGKPSRRSLFVVTIMIIVGLCSALPYDQAHRSTAEYLYYRQMSIYRQSYTIHNADMRLAALINCNVCYDHSPRFHIPQVNRRKSRKTVCLS